MTLVVAVAWSVPWSTASQVVAAALFALTMVILLIRLAGLRALSKMSGFDFAVTVAIGSVLGSGVASDTPVIRSVVAIASLLGAQWIVAQLRLRAGASRVVDNQPTVLVRDGHFDDDAMRRTRVLRSDVVAKLRQANVASLSQVHAVVLETTGDMSILHGEEKPSDELLADVRGSRPSHPPDGPGEDPPET